MARTKRIAIILLLATTAQAASWRAVLRATQAMLVAGATADAASSYGKGEINPVLGRGQFGARQAAIKGALLSSALAAECIAAHHAPKAWKPLALINAASAVTLGIVAARNTLVP